MHAMRCGHNAIGMLLCCSQVERLRNPALEGKPLAVQQHQDVIAVDYAARAAGVRKHMAPAQASYVWRAGGHRREQARGCIHVAPGQANVRSGADGEPTSKG